MASEEEREKINKILSNPHLGSGIIEKLGSFPSVDWNAFSSGLVVVTKNTADGPRLPSTMLKGDFPGRESLLIRIDCSSIFLIEFHEIGIEAWGIRFLVTDLISVLAESPEVLSIELNQTDIRPIHLNREKDQEEKQGEGCR